MKKGVEYYLSLEYPVEMVRRKDGVFAFHPDLDGCAAQGETVEEAISNLDAARDLWIRYRVEDGLPIQEPISEAEYSGRISLRMTPDLHSQLAKIARRQGVSLNQKINNILTEYSGGRSVAEAVREELREMLKGATRKIEEKFQIAFPPGSEFVTADAQPPAKRIIEQAHARMVH